MPGLYGRSRKVNPESNWLLKEVQRYNVIGGSQKRMS